jgi:hypothetical protein
MGGLYARAKQLLLPMPITKDQPTSPTPLDLEVTRLIQDGKIRQNTKDIAYFIAREGVISGCRWGDYYQQRRCEAAPVRAKQRARAARQARSFANHLDLLPRLVHIASGFEPSAPPEHQLSPVALNRLLAAAADLRKDLNSLANACAQTPTSLTGRVGDPWLHGFIFGMGYAWREIATLKVSADSERFKSFLQAGLASVMPKVERNWTSVVKTAIDRFHMGQEQWLLPGDDLRAFW